MTAVAVIAAGVVVGLSPAERSRIAGGPPLAFAPAGSSSPVTAGTATAPPSAAAGRTAQPSTGRRRGTSPTRTRRRATSPTTTAPGRDHSSRRTDTHHHTSTTTGAGGPVLTSVSPRAGAPGTQVVLTGKDLWSPTGTVVVRFGRIAASVDCASRSRCTATAPGGVPSGPVEVTFTAAGSTSPAVHFQYQ